MVQTRFEDTKESRIEFKTNLMLALYVVLILTANFIGGKVTQLWGIEFTVAIFLMPVSVLITDIIQEVYGKKKIKQFVKIALICLVIVMAYTALSVYAPFAGRSFVKEEYTKVFGMSLRMMLASLIAFALAQYHDIWAFNFWKQKTKGKYLWLRNNLSSIVSEFIDTTIFMFLAFYAISPKFTAAYILLLIIPYWILKSVVVVAHTPLCYLGVWWLKK